eukprot:COSAG01_NODE_7273_length_3273_cov_2.418583_2_plen_215_part_01
MPKKPIIILIHGQILGVDTSPVCYIMVCMADCRAQPAAGGAHRVLLSSWFVRDRRRRRHELSASPTGVRIPVCKLRTWGANCSTVATQTREPAGRGGSRGVAEWPNVGGGWEVGVGDWVRVDCAARQRDSSTTRSVDHSRLPRTTRHAVRAGRGAGCGGGRTGVKVVEGCGFEQVWGGGSHSPCTYPSDSAAQTVWNSNVRRLKAEGKDISSFDT